ncbi:MAG: ribonuclease HII [Bacteriovoracaceae bacterium]
MIELKLISSFPQEIIAMDEVGRSPLCGPVVIGAVRIFINQFDTFATLVRSMRRNGVKDSKMLSHEQRQEVLNKLGIKEMPFREKGIIEWKGIRLSYVTWDMQPDVIDAENIFQASMRGMKEAADFLSIENKNLTTLLLDGQSKLRWSGDPYPWREIPIVKGDAKSPLIGLASIIAKEKRDLWMRQQHELYPQYGLNSNFGYPTKGHREAIAHYGVSPIHRKTFNKVKEFVKN